MILEGANILKEETNYTIYAMNSSTAGQYCVIIPKSTGETVNMLIDLHKKNIFDEVTSGRKSKEELINELIKEYNDVKVKYENGILILPMISEEEFKIAVDQLNKQKMFDETKKIGAITSELYKKLTEIGIQKQKIDQKIIIILKKAEDEKYVNWLKEQMPNYVDGVSLEEKKEEVENPFANGDIFGISNEEVKNEVSTPEEKIEIPSVETPVAKSTGGIFDNIPSPVDVKGTSPLPETAPSVVEAPKPTIENNNTESANIFETKSETIESTPEPPKPTPTVQEQTPDTKESATQFFEAPRPLKNVELEGTTTFSAIPNIPQETVENTNEEPLEKNKKSGGFVNLAIILVVLIIVTIASVELGKFLYSVYGA